LYLNMIMILKLEGVVNDHINTLDTTK
jgi:hypothetical protein